MANWGSEYGNRTADLGVATALPGQWTRWHYILLLVGIVWGLGILFVEFFFYYTTRLRSLNPELKKKYFPFTNEPHKWSKLVFYLCISSSLKDLGSILIIPRAISFGLSSVLLALWTKLLLLGADPNQPISGLRKALIRLAGQGVTRFGLFCQSFVWVSHRHLDVDYAEWLGPEWRTQRPPGRPPILISNHMSWSDILLAMTFPEFPGFISGIHVKNYPLYGSIAQGIGSAFVNRENAESRSAAVSTFTLTLQLNTIKERVADFAADPRYSPLMIFPEGLTTNGKTVLMFKRGAFAAETSIQPFFIEYVSPFCNASFDIIPTLLHFFFMSCQPYTIIRLYRLPVIYPTAFMYNKYKDWGQSNGDIYAAVVRDIYVRTFKLQKSDLTLADKNKLYDFLYDYSKTKLD